MFLLLFNKAMLFCCNHVIHCTNLIGLGHVGKEANVTFLNEIKIPPIQGLKVIGLSGTNIYEVGDIDHILFKDFLESFKTIFPPLFFFFSFFWYYGRYKNSANQWFNLIWYFIDIYRINLLITVIQLMVLISPRYGGLIQIRYVKYLFILKHRSLFTDKQYITI